MPQQLTRRNLLRGVLGGSAGAIAVSAVIAGTILTKNGLVENHRSWQKMLNHIEKNYQKKRIAVLVKRSRHVFLERF